MNSILIVGSARPKIVTKRNCLSFPLNATKFISFYPMYIIFREIEIILRYLHLNYFIF